MKAPILFRMTTPLGDAYEIPYHQFGARLTKPALALVGGIHGNELNSVFVLARLAAKLHAIENGEQPGQSIQQRVIIIPAVNLLGMHTRQRNWPLDQTDINRMFPGYSVGETTQRIADAVFQATREAAVRVDIHSSNLEFEELPQVRVYGSNREERETAKAMGLPAVVECPINKISSATLLNAWRGEGGQNFVLQLGSAGELQMDHCNAVERALWRLLVRLEILSGVLESTEDDPPDVHVFAADHTVSLVSEKAGLLVSRMTLGQWVQEGQLLGQVFDGFTGRPRARLKVPASGLLTGLRRQALLFEGDLLARIQSKTPVAAGADTYLIGQGQ